MKQKIAGLITIAFLCFFTFTAFKNYSFNYQIISCGVNTANGVSGELIGQATATIQKGKGKTTTTTTYTIDGTKAMIQRFKAGDGCFEVVASTGQANPTGVVNLFKVVVGKTNRTFTLTNDGTTAPGEISFQLTPVDGSPGHFKVFLGPGATFLQGEYVFADRSTITTDGKINVWAFGIDQ